MEIWPFSSPNNERWHKGAGFFEQSTSAVALLELLLVVSIWRFDMDGITYVRLWRMGFGVREETVGGAR